MTGLERVGAALAGQPGDRRACAPVLSLYGARLAGIPLERYYREPGLYREGQAAVVRRFDPDIVFAPFALPLEAEAWGAKLAFFDRAPPNVRSFLSAPEALLGREAPDPALAPPLSYLVESLRLVAADNAGSRPVAAILTAPCDLPAILLGLDAWLELFLFDRAAADAALELAARHFLSMSRAAFAAGAAFVATPVMLSSPRILVEGLVRERIIPFLSRVFAEAGGPIVFHHGANPLAAHLGLVKDLPAVAGFVLDERDDFAAARALLGPGRLLLGGINGPLFEARSPARLAAMVKATAEGRRDDTAWILATGAADVPYDTPPENLDAVFGALRG